MTNSDSASAPPKPPGSMLWPDSLMKVLAEAQRRGPGTKLFCLPRGPGKSMSLWPKTFLDSGAPAPSSEPAPRS